MAQLPSMLPGVRELLRGEFEGEDDQDKAAKGGKASGGGRGGEGKGGERKKAEKKSGEKKGERKNGGAAADSSGGGGGSSSGDGGAEEKEMLALVLYMHGSVEGATPLEYLSFLTTWKELHDSKRGGMSLEIKKLRSGLDKLNSATVTVDELSKNAAVSAKELAEAQVKADNAMETITKVCCCFELVEGGCATHIVVRSCSINVIDFLLIHHIDALMLDISNGIIF
jgi:hypothetical protein